MRIACCIPKAINTHLEYVIIIAFPLQQWLEERPSVFTLYVHYLSFCKLKLCLYLKRIFYWEVTPYSSVGKYECFRGAYLHIYPTTRHHVSDDSKLHRYLFLVNDQRDAQFISMYLFLFLNLYMFWAHRAHHQETENVSIQPLVAVTLCR